MRWSEYKHFETLDWKTIPRSPGVYYIRCVNNSGKPIRIPRLGGVDNEGIVYIGETGRNLRNRVRNFWKTAHNFRVNSHRGGWNFSYWGYNKIFPLKNLEFSYMSCKNKDHSERMEVDCLWDYRKTKSYIDLPPMNFSSGGEK